MITLRRSTMMTILVFFVSSGFGFATPLGGQIVTVGAGALVSERRPEPVAEITAMTVPILGVRAFTTGSWTDNEWQPTVITALDYAIPSGGTPMVSMGPGLLWLHGNDYRPHPIWQGAVIVPLAKSNFSLVTIGSTQPFQRFQWSVVLKVAFAVLFKP